MIRSGRAGGGESWKNMQGMSLPRRGLRGPDKEENWELEIVVELRAAKESAICLFRLQNQGPSGLPGAPHMN